MASKKLEKHSYEWEMFASYWALCKRFWIPEDNEKYWEALYEEAGEFMRKYESEILSKYLGLALIDALGEKIKTESKIIM